MPSQKRTSDHLSPPINEVQKKYQWNPECLLSKNKYYLPDHLEPSGSSESQQRAEKAVKTVKIPAIFLHGPVNHKEVIADIKNLTKAEFSTSLSATSLKISLTAEDDYRALVKHYAANKVEFHSFQNPSEKPHSVVIKNVPPSLTEEDLQKELAIYNLPILKITRLLNKDKTPMPVCAVDLTANEKANEIYKVNKICYSIVSVEPRRKSRNIPQCHRCQRFGHTKNYCALEPRCVKCQGKHLYTECDKKKNDPPVCTNCGEGHPANYRGCKYYMQSSNVRNIPRQNNTQNIAANTNLQTKAGPSQRKTYANVTNNNNSSSPNQQSNTAQNTPSSQTPSVINTILTFLLNFIQPYIEEIKKFLITNLLPNLFNGP